MSVTQKISRLVRWINLKFVEWIKILWKWLWYSFESDVASVLQTLTERNKPSDNFDVDEAPSMTDFSIGKLLHCEFL